MESYNPVIAPGFQEYCLSDQFVHKVDCKMTHESMYQRMGDEEKRREAEKNKKLAIL
jgi:hypothetical protein